MILMDDAHNSGRGIPQLVVIHDSPCYGEVPLKYFLRRSPVRRVVSYLQKEDNIHQREDKKTRFPAYCDLYNLNSCS